MNSSKIRIMADSFLLNAMLSLCGGYLDAYTYVVRDHVFANTVTGNTVLLGIHLLDRNFGMCLRYLVPLAAFAAGAFLSSWVHQKDMDKAPYWRKEVLFLEIIVLTAVGFLPVTHNNIANAMVAFACALQAQTFRKVGSYTYASTMCTGNLRSCASALSLYIIGKDHEDLKRFGTMGGMILAFMLGAGGGALVSRVFGTYSVLVPVAVLFILFSIMGRKRRQAEASA